jgi:acetyl-CoA C-acetyltransferase
VLVGCGQVTQRVSDPSEGVEPLELMLAASERAAEDAGSRELLRRADSIRVGRGVWRYANPAAWLAERIGTQGPTQTGLGPISGSTVQKMLHHAASEIAAGRRDVVLLAGGECEHSRRRAKSADVLLEWTRQEEPAPDETFGSHDPGFGPVEMRYRLRPIQTFSLYENALRAHRGEDPQAHRVRISLLWARLAAVAAANPYAWNRKGLSAEEIRTESDENRMVAYPYTKYLVSNMVVDMGAALILCSVEAASRHGVPEDRWVFPQAATGAEVELPFAAREAFHDQPIIGTAGRRALELAGRTPEEVAHVDLYSCFPSAVQIAADEIGFDPERELSVTGGLTWNGGPFNSYVVHAVATLMERLRAEPDSVGFVSSVGGYMAKHAFGVYGSAPPEGGFRYEDCSEAASALPGRSWNEHYAGPARLETFAQVPAAEGEGDRLLGSFLTEDGRRSFASNPDPALLASAAREELCGREARLADGGFELT